MMSYWNLKELYKHEVILDTDYYSTQENDLWEWVDEYIGIQKNYIVALDLGKSTIFFFNNDEDAMAFKLRWV